jgi:hypothetical protein
MLSKSILVIFAAVAVMAAVIAAVFAFSPNTESTGTPVSAINSINNNVQQANSLSFYVYQEPTVGAFSMLVPATWTGSSALVPHYATFNPQIFFQITDQTGTKSIAFQEYSIPDFTDPSADTLGRPEGSWMVDGFNLSFHYLSAGEYAQTFMIQELEKAYDNVQLVSVFPATEPWRTQTAGGASIADAIYSATRGGIAYDIATTIYTIPTGGGFIWSSSYYIFSAPQGQLEDVMQLYSLVAPTYRPDSNFVLSRIRQAGVVSSVTTQTSAELRSIYGQAYANAQESSSRIGEKWSDAILGTMDVTNPATGDRLTVSNDFRFWWVDGLGNVIASNTEGSPDPQRNLTLLQPVGP